MLKTIKTALLSTIILGVLGYAYQQSIRSQRPTLLTAKVTNITQIQHVTELMAKAPWLKHFAFGYDDLYGDVLGLLTNQILAAAGRDSSAPLVALIAQVAAQRPRNEQFYLEACQYLMNASERPQDCLPLIMTGLGVFPQSWRLPLLQGFVHAVKLKQPAQAASFYAIAGSRRGSPAWVSELAQVWQKDAAR